MMATKIKKKGKNSSLPDFRPVIAELVDFKCVFIYTSWDETITMGNLNMKHVHVDGVKLKRT